MAGLLIGEFDGTNTNMYLTDALGSVLETISATPNSAAVQGNQIYGPYGTSRYQQGTMDTTLGFTGQYNDSLTGLDYYGARYYDPVVGRFLSADPVEGNPLGMDPYAYVEGNPETASDPSGLRVISQGGQLGPRNAIVSPTNPNPATYNVPLQALQSAIGHGSSQENQSPCPYSVGGHGSAADCMSERTATQAPFTSWATYRSRVSTPIGVLACGSLGGPCVSVYLTGQVTIEAHGLVQGTAVLEVTICATNVLACAAGEAGGEGAKGEAESSEADYPFSEPGQQTKAAVAAAGNEGGPCSFTPQTAVTTDHGEQAIGTLQVGERVLAYNPKTHTMDLEPILHVWINHDHDLVDLTITTTTQGQQGKATTKTSEVVHTNQKHPFFSMEQGFLPVGKIKLGMHILRADGGMGVVTGWKVVPGTQVMYNLEVAQDHTFTVGAGQWVVHNDCPSGSGTPSGNNPSAQSGNRFHYDQLNGGPAGSIGGPSQLQAMYPQTDFAFALRGAAGPDVEVTGGVHPSDTSVYESSTWPEGSDYGDFKPWSNRGQRQFRYEIASGKLPVGTVPIWYDPVYFTIVKIGT